MILYKISLHDYRYRAIYREREVSVENEHECNFRHDRKEVNFKHVDRADCDSIFTAARDV